MGLKEYAASKSIAVVVIIVVCLFIREIEYLEVYNANLSLIIYHWFQSINS